MFGTNSEANSLSVDERIALLETLLSAGLRSDAHDARHRLLCPDRYRVRLTAHAVKAGCAGVLMLPPFYYKDVSDDGLYRHFAEVIERVGDARVADLSVPYPPVAVVGITPALVERLIKRYPSAIAGMKDSSGDWSNTKTMLDSFAASGFDVFPGSESFLLAGMRHGAAGCISATANVNPAAIDRLYQEWQRYQRRPAAGGAQYRAQDRWPVRDDPGAQTGDRTLCRRPRMGDGAPTAHRTDRSPSEAGYGGAAWFGLQHAGIDGAAA